MKVSKENLKNIILKLRRPRAATVFILVSIISYSLLALSANSSLVITYLAEFNFSSLMSVSYSLITGYPGAVQSYIVATTAVTALFIGLNFSLLTETISVEGAAGGTTGSILGLTVSGCAACTTGAISLAGASIGLSFLPFNGLEFNLFGILLLGYTALYISDKEMQKICEV